ncbi:MAG: hypothetical protein K2L18_11985 [Acetatifactor sp.]|nr:hypothetical protein [Acetatifactor sp.]
MSYDLLVFEKRGIPTNRPDFLNWYIQKLENEDEQDISCVSEKLQRFFHSVRHIFPPMNGEFAPDDQELSENPAMEEYLCDYSITEDMIYLSFAYSVSEFDYNTIKRAAYFAEVGFFNSSDDESAPVLFDSRCPMLIEGEWFRLMETDSFESICEKLNNMTVKNRSYLYVTDQVGNYIQIGGYGDSFTVERRIYTNPTTYIHAKAGCSDTENSDKAGEVIIAGNHVKVKQNQILSKAMAEQLFLDFFQGLETVDSIEWVEMDI